MPKISDYKGYNYQKDYWQTQNRTYEDTVEKRTIRYLLKKAPKAKCILDAGCGFGRLYPAYKGFADRYILLDYAENMIEGAKTNLKDEKDLTFKQGDLYKTPLKDAEVDQIITVRTLHHFTDPEKLFAEFHRILSPGGHIIFEIPNKRHLINIIKYALGDKSRQPFTKSPLKHAETFLNFHPKHIKSILKETGFTIKAEASTNFFRSSLLKRLIPLPILSTLDAALRRTFPLSITPSLFILAQKD